MTAGTLVLDDDTEYEASTPFVFETISSREGLNAHREEWTRLARRFGNPLLGHDWISSCAAAFCPPGHMNILIQRSHGRINAIAPLVRCSRLGIGHLELPGTAYLMEPASFLFDNDSLLEPLFEAVLELNKPLFLMRLLPHPALQSAIQEAARKKSFFIIEHTNSSPWIPIASTWNDFEKQMPSRRRSDLRRMRRHLEAEGAVDVEIHTESSPDFGLALDEAFRIEGSGWKAKKGTAVLSNTKLRAFFTTYLPAASESGIVRLFLLKVNRRGIAMVLGVEHSQRLWILKVGYDESWARFAPGILLHHETIRWAFDQHLEGYEFLGITEPWTRMWTDKTHTYHTYRVIPRSLKGLVWLGIEGARVLLKKAADLSVRLSMIMGIPLCLEPLK